MLDQEFNPQLSPSEMLELGIFGGWYFKGDISEYPKEWFVSAKISHTGFDSTLNYFKVASGQAMSVWKDKGWITSEDPLGWFQWYCRYSLGRRISEVDEFQIKTIVNHTIFGVDLSKDKLFYNGLMTPLFKI